MREGNIPQVMSFWCRPLTCCVIAEVGNLPRKHKKLMELKKMDEEKAASSSSRKTARSDSVRVRSDPHSMGYMYIFYIYIYIY